MSASAKSTHSRETLATFGNADLVALLGRCLALRHGADATAKLRAELLAGPSVWQALTDRALELRLAMALEESLRGRGLLVSQWLPSASGPTAPDDKLCRYAAKLRARRDVLASHLRSIIARLNGAGIEPIVIKGAQSLLTGEPSWRDLRDIDLLVDAKEAVRAQAELIAMGYNPPQELRERPRRHHLVPLLRNDLPGFLEIHRRGGNRYANALLPTEELLRESRRHNQDGLEYRLMPLPLHTLYAIVHHHVGHSSDARGTVDVKGLYEFAWGFVRMSDAERKALSERAERHPRLHAALDFWIAAAADLFDMPSADPFEVPADAARRWKKVLSRLDRPRPWYKYPGYAEEIRMASATRRIRRAPGGSHALGRAILRIEVLASLLPKFTL